MARDMILTFIDKLEHRGRNVYLEQWETLCSSAIPRRLRRSFAKLVLHTSHSGLPLHWDEGWSSPCHRHQQPPPNSKQGRVEKGEEGGGREREGEVEEERRRRWVRREEARRRRLPELGHREGTGGERGGSDEGEGRKKINE